MWKIAVRGFRASFVRFLLTLFSVILGSAFLTGTLALRDALHSQFLSIAQTTQVFDLYVEGAKREGGSAETGGTSRAQIPDTLLDEVSDLPGVSFAFPDYVFLGGLQDTDGHSITGDSFAPTLIVGNYIGTLDYRNQHFEGALPKGPHEIVLEEGAATALDLATGDQLDIVYADIVREVTIVGIVNYGSTMAGANVVLMDGDAVRDILREQRRIQVEAGVRADLASDPEISQLPDEMAQAAIDEAAAQAVADVDAQPLDIGSLSIEVEENADVDSVRADIAAHLENVWTEYDLSSAPEVLTRQAVIDEYNADIETQVGFVNIFLLVFVGIALFVSIFIISNTFRMIVQSQQNQFAMLRAIGASRRHIFGIVTAQGLAIGILGSILGIGLGAGLAQGLKSLLAEFSLVLSDIPVSPGVMATTLIVGISVTFLGALLPARSAAKIPPVAAMREAQLAGQRVTPWATALAGVLLIAGVVGVWASRMDGNEHAGAFLGAGIVLALVGLLLATPALTAPLIGVLSLPFRGPTGQLARRNVLRNPRRTAATASALTIGVSLVVLGAVMAETMRDATAGVVDEQLKAEFTVVSQGGASIDSTTLISRLRDVDGVAYVNDELTGVTLEVRPPGADDYIQDIVISVGPESIGRDFIIPNVEGDLASFVEPSGTDIPVLVSRRLARDLDISPGDALSLKGDKAERPGVVAAIIDSAILKRDYAVAADDLDDLGAPVLVKNTLLISLQDGADAEKAKAAIDDLVAEYDGLAAMTKDEYKDQIADMVNIMLAIVYALLGLSMIIAVLGIINTQSLSIGERIREIGLLRAIGLGRGRIGLMVVIESILTALLGTLLGFLAGTAISFGLIDYLIRADLGITRFVFPTGIIAYTVIGAVVIGSIAGLVPAIRAARIRLLTAIATD